MYSQAQDGVAISSNTTGVFNPNLSNMTQGGNYDFGLPNTIKCCPKGAKVYFELKLLYKCSKHGRYCRAKRCVRTNCKCTITNKDALANATVEWYETQPNIPSVTPPTAQGMYFTPSFTTVGTHSVYASQRLNGCMSEIAQISFTIKPLPAPPSTTSASICQGQTHVALQATGTGITWYQNANKTGGKLLTNSNTYIPSVITTTTFHASQTVDECESSTSPAVYTIKPNPTKPVIQTTEKSCDTETEHILTVTPETGAVIRWYSLPDTSSYITSGNEYKHQIQGLAGQKTYYARKVVDGCLSEVSSKYFTIVQTPQHSFNY